MTTTSPPPYHEKADYPSTNYASDSKTFTTYRPIPASFTMFTTKLPSEDGGRTIHLGTRKGSPCKAVSTHQHWSLRYSINLHVGLTRETPRLASASMTCTSYLGGKVAITIPNTTESDAGHVDSTPLELGMSFHGWWTRTADFEVEVGDKLDKRLEKFEWRQTSKGGVPSCGREWKLHRLNSNSGGSGETPDVVAAWTTSYGGLRLKGNFDFVGAGLTGELGETWAKVAVITGMSIGSIQRRNQQSAVTAVVT